MDTITTYWPKVEGIITSSPSSYDSKLKKIRKKTENALKEFPIALVKEPFENGRYKLALNRAQKELRKKSYILREIPTVSLDSLVMISTVFL